MALLDEPKPPARTIRVELNGRSVLLAICGVALVWLFVQLWPVLLVILVALMIAGALAPPIARLERLKIRRLYAIAVVFVGLLVATIALGALTLPTLVDQVGHVITHLPEAKNDLAKQLDSTPLGAPFARSLRRTSVTEIVTEAQHMGLALSSQLV